MSIERSCQVIMIILRLVEFLSRSIQLLFIISALRWKMLRLKIIHCINRSCLLSHFWNQLLKKMCCVYVLNNPTAQTEFLDKCYKSSIIHSDLLTVFKMGIRLTKENLTLKALGDCSTRFWIRNLRNRIYHLYLLLVNGSFLIQDK